MGRQLLAPKTKLILTIGIALVFFSAELSVGFYTHSLALIADAFHYLCDLIGFVVALVALIISERPEPAPQGYTFGWQRAKLLGAFFNGVFLLALGISILVQAIERFVDIQPIDQPLLILIMGAVGLTLNVLVMSFLHEHSHDHDHSHGHDHRQGHTHSHSHDHSHNAVTDSAAPNETSQGSVSHGVHSDPESAFQLEHIDTTQTMNHDEHKHNELKGHHVGRDLGMLGVLVHVIGDAINNVGVIIAAVIIWKADGHARYYADPAIGVFIAIMILLTAVPLTRSSGSILLQIAPPGINIDDVKQDIEKIPGIDSVHELHIWRLDQRKSIASAHVVVDGRTVRGFADKAKTIMECLHAYGVHSATLQPESKEPSEASMSSSSSVHSGVASDLRSRTSTAPSGCQLVCGSVCSEMRCCL